MTAYEAGRQARSAAEERALSSALGTSSRDRVSRRLIDWIWTISGRLPLPLGQTGEAALDRLDLLFRQAGTTRERTADSLVFAKRDAAAQDRLAVFDRGTLKIEAGPAGPELRYRLTSRALLFCFLAPLLFLTFAQLTVAINKLERPLAEAAKEHDKKDAALPLNPIDQALGAPAPEKPNKKKDKSEGHDKKPTPTPSYVFAGIFTMLYVAGRVLEAILVRRLFRRSLLDL